MSIRYTKDMNEEGINEKRRMLIKLGALSVASFALAKLFGPALEAALKAPEHTDYKNFRVVDNGDTLHIYDKTGRELLVVQKDDSPTEGQT